VVSFPKVSPLKPSIHHFCPQYVLHARITFGEQYTAQSCSFRTAVLGFRHYISFKTATSALPDRTTLTLHHNVMQLHGALVSVISYTPTTKVRPSMCRFSRNSLHYLQICCSELYKDRAVRYRAVLLNRRAAARYRALAPIIPGRETFSWNFSF